MQLTECSFILSVEKGDLEAQAILLVESLRTFGGKYSKCPVYALSPRPSMQMGQACQNKLRSLGAYIIIEDLLPANEQYGTAARLACSAWAERNLESEIIICLDDDLFFVREPDFEMNQVDFIARPVDVKGMCTTGPNDPFDEYWRRISQVCGANYEDIPWITTTIDNIRVRASYNGGMIAVRRNMGIFQKAAAMFEILRYHNLSPHTPGSANVFASTGFVGIESSRWWGSSQAVLSLAVTQLRARTRIALPTYNIPAHLLKEAKTFGVDITLQNAILVHYHWLLHSKFIKREKILYGGEDLPANVLLWLRSRTPLDEKTY